MSPYPDAVLILAEDLLEICIEAGLRLALAESCTGGLVAGCVTAVPGASAVLDRGFVTYANESKIEMLDVEKEIIEANGAVSEPVALAMAKGALARSKAHISLSITGIAGPGGGSEGKPAGLVHMASARNGGETVHERHVFKGDRDSVRMQAVQSGLRLLLRQALS